MNLNNPGADIFTLDDKKLPEALARTTHLGVGAHQDDLEIMAYHGITECFQREDKWFTGVTCTVSPGSPRSGAYAKYTSEMMIAQRKKEQRLAAMIGQYSAMLQLGYPGPEVRTANPTGLISDLTEILKAARPEFIYTHNPADKHSTHVAVVVALIKALRNLPSEYHPKKIYGCEVWRNLDWAPDSKKVILNCEGHENIASALVEIFDSQVSGGKRYDLATMARRTANATYLESNQTDQFYSVSLALDLTPLLNSRLSVQEFMGELMEDFRKSVVKQIGEFEK